MLIELLIVLVIIGGLLYLMNTLPIDARIKTVIYVVVFIVIAVWLLRHLGALGLNI